MARTRVEHQRRIMRAVEAGLRGKKRAFDMPPGDGAAQFFVLLPQPAKARQAPDELWPCVGDEGEHESRAARSAQRPRRLQQLPGGQIVAPKIAPATTVPLP